jgi:CheY-like chemotaxis protein
MSVVISSRADFQPRPALSRTSWRVLIADESAANRSQLSASLEAFDPAIRIVEAPDGGAAVDVLIETPPDLAFVNVQLPDVTGAEALAFARAKGMRTTSILMASQIVPRWVEFAQELDAYEFLMNPLDPEHVGQLLRGIRRMRSTTRLLVVIESEANRALVRKVLQSSRFDLEIEETDSGRHALKRMRLADYDVALIDTYLTGMDGLETACQARETAPDTKLIMMANEESSLLAQSARHFGVSWVLTKPFYAPDVDVALHKVFGLRRPYLLNALINTRGAPPTPDR